MSDCGRPVELLREEAYYFIPSMLVVCSHTSRKTPILSSPPEERDGAVYQKRTGIFVSPGPDLAGGTSPHGTGPSYLRMV